jgi:dihydrofolate reductase
MILSFIVALADNNAIGINNELPWHLPDDLKFFKKTTLGKPVLMGRKTYESLGKPLKGRLNIVVSSNPSFRPEDGVLVYKNMEDAVARLSEEPIDEAFIIGGGKVFTDTLHLAQRMYLTRVHTSIPDADAFFPSFNEAEWKLSWSEDHVADEKHRFSFTFQQWERVKQ